VRFTGGGEAEGEGAASGGTGNGGGARFNGRGSLGLFPAVGSGILAFMASGGGHVLVTMAFSSRSERAKEDGEREQEREISLWPAAQLIATRAVSPLAMHRSYRMKKSSLCTVAEVD
jgi:hypothetical protein